MQLWLVLDHKKREVLRLFSASRSRNNTCLQLLFNSPVTLSTKTTISKQLNLSYQCLSAVKGFLHHYCLHKTCHICGYYRFRNTKCTKCSISNSNS